ncbi:hypothetical protein DSB72_26255, partial [Salmonella enterica subsp. enterica serovar Typhimurium]
VATSGNVSISGVILNGSSTSAGGSGATLSGNLTIAFVVAPVQGKITFPKSSGQDAVCIAHFVSP